MAFDFGRAVGLGLGVEPLPTTGFGEVDSEIRQRLVIRFYESLGLVVFDLARCVLLVGVV